jgi:hypothetical protein
MNFIALLAHQYKEYENPVLVKANYFHSHAAIPHAQR